MQQPISIMQALVQGFDNVMLSKHRKAGLFLVGLDCTTIHLQTTMVVPAALRIIGKNVLVLVSDWADRTDSELDALVSAVERAGGRALAAASINGDSITVGGERHLISEVRARFPVSLQLEHSDLARWSAEGRRESRFEPVEPAEVADGDVAGIFRSYEREGLPSGQDVAMLAAIALRSKRDRDLLLVTAALGNAPAGGVTEGQRLIQEDPTHRPNGGAIRNRIHVLEFAAAHLRGQAADELLAIAGYLYWHIEAPEAAQRLAERTAEVNLSRLILRAIACGMPPLWAQARQDEAAEVRAVLVEAIAEG